jgi:hypothetical protein
MQLRELCAYAARCLLPITAEFINQLIGTTADRPAVDTILVRTFDPFARSTGQLIDALKEFRQLDVEFLPIIQHTDTSSPMGSAMFTEISATAEFKHALITVWVRAATSKTRATVAPNRRTTWSRRSEGHAGRVRVSIVLHANSALPIRPSPTTLHNRMTRRGVDDGN